MTYRRPWVAEIEVIRVPCPPERAHAYWAAMRIMASWIRPDLDHLRSQPPTIPVCYTPARSAPILEETS